MSESDLSSSCSVEEALSGGWLRVGMAVRIDPTVRFVFREDDGSHCGGVIISDDVIIRAGAVVCSGVTIGKSSVVGHHTVIRARAIIGELCVISHMTCVERDTSIGNNVRVSALTHLTGGCIVEDDVQIGARVATVNDLKMEFRNNPVLKAPIFRKRCRVGSGCTVLGGIEIGERSFIGAHSLISKSVPPDAVAFGVPAYVVRWLRRDETLDLDMPW